MSKKNSVMQGTGAVRVERHGDRSRLTVRCSCGEMATSGLSISAPSEVAIRSFRQRGWKIDPSNSRATCPTCQETPVSNDKTPTPAAFGGQRRMWKLLEDHLERDASGAASSMDGATRA